MVRMRRKGSTDGEGIADKLGIRRVADLEFVEKEDTDILVLKPIPKIVFRKMVAKHVSGGVSGRGMLMLVHCFLFLHRSSA